MAATKTTQILNHTELKRKLGGTVVSPEEVDILNADEINTTWGNNVYLAGGLTGEVIPDNGEVRPVFNFKYGSSATAAYENVSTNAFNVKFDNWDSRTVFDIKSLGITTTYKGYLYNSSGNAAPSGYYMFPGTVSTNPDIYQYLRVTGTSGQIYLSSGNYIFNYTPHYFNWDSSYTIIDNYLVTELPTTNSYSIYSFSTSETSLSVASKYRVSFSSAKSSATELSTQITSSSVSLKRTQINSGYPFLIAKIKGKHDGTDWYHGILAVPPDSYWTLSAPNKTVNDTYQSNVGISASTNMGGGWKLSKASNVNWVNVNADEQTLEIMGNGTYDDRSTIINISDRIDVTFSNIDSDLGSIHYQGALHTSSFTLTQEGMPKPVLYVVLFPSYNIGTFYLVDSPNTEWNRQTSRPTGEINAPAAIRVGQITIRVGLTQEAASDFLNYVEYSSNGVTIMYDQMTGHNNGFIMWTQESDDVGDIYHENGEIIHGTKQIQQSYNNVAIQESSVAVSWFNTVPQGWQLNNQLIIK